MLLADLWWARQFSPEAARFLLDWHVLRLTLDTTAILLAAAWFSGHLLVVLRAVGSVQIPRKVGDLEIREAISPSALLALAVGVGLLLGLIAGVGASEHWRRVALAWEGVRYNLTDPLLGRDAGFYVAQLPLLRLIQHYASNLALFAAVAVLFLYLVIGAVRLSRAGVALNDHARQHLGTTLSALAIAIALGFLLEPAEYVGAMNGAPTLNGFRRIAIVAPALTGTALMAALLSLYWARRGRPAILAAGWVVLALATLLARSGVPVAIHARTVDPLPDSLIEAFESQAFGLRRGGAADLPVRLHAPLFDRAEVAQMIGEGAGASFASAGLLRTNGQSRAVWYVMHRNAGGSASIFAISADSATPSGQPLTFRLGDTLAYPTFAPLRVLDRASAYPGLDAFAEVPTPRGVATGGLFTRLALAWALQDTRLLRGGAPPLVDWYLDPLTRLERLAPFARWSGLRAAMRDSAIYWIADGYLDAPIFPLVQVRSWAGGDAATLAAPYVGIVEAASGRVQIARRAGSSPLADSWDRLATGVVAPAPGGWASQLSVGPPLELFSAQVRVIERQLNGDVVGGRVGAATGLVWDSLGRWGAVAAIPPSEGDWVASMALSFSGGPPSVISMGDAPPIPGPEALNRLWQRFATFAPVQDSITAAGAQSRRGPVRYFVWQGAPSAWQVITASRAQSRPTVVWVNVASGTKVGAGRSVPDAWSNLMGTTAPLPPGAADGTLGEARRWLRVADEALKRGDWPAFGRAFDALRETMEPAR